MNKELVSIAMATYNGKKFLKEQLDSIYGQTYENLEVIVTDDCSTDGTLEILDEYSKKFGLKYFANEKNVGPIKNFEKVMSLCNGRYIALADQDDIWFPEKIETLVNNIGSYSLICSDAHLIDQNGNTIAKSFMKHSGIPARSGKPFNILLYNNFVTGCTTLLKKELLQKALPIPKKDIFHDWWLALVSLKMDGIKYLDIPLIYFRQHTGSFTGAFKPWSLKQSFIHVYKRIRKRKTQSGVYRQRRARYNRLRALEASSLFEGSEKRYLKEAIEYLDDYFHSRIHFKAFTIAIKNRDLVFPFATNPFSKFIYILTELID